MPNVPHLKRDTHTQRKAFIGLKSIRTIYENQKVYCLKGAVSRNSAKLRKLQSTRSIKRNIEITA